MIVFQSASHSHHWCNFILRALLIPHSSFLLHPSPPYSLSLPVSLSLLRRENAKLDHERFPLAALTATFFILKPSR
jgi:hypothetical protein